MGLDTTQKFVKIKVVRSNYTYNYAAKVINEEFVAVKVGVHWRVKDSDICFHESECIELGDVFTKDMLEDWMVVQTREGETGLVCLRLGRILFSDNTFILLENLKEDMKLFHEELDITKVFSSRYVGLHHTLHDNKGELLWERVEEALGQKELRELGKEQEALVEKQKTIALKIEELRRKV